MTDPIIPHIVARHAEEAAFLWPLRDRAVAQPHQTLFTLARLDERLEAHLDGLRVAGPAGSDAAAALFSEDPGPGEAFSAAVLALEAARPEAVEAVLACAATAPAHARALVSAVGWLTDDAAAVAVPLLQGLGGPLAAWVGIAGAAARRLHPGPALDAALAHPDPRLRARAAEAVGELGDLSRVRAVRDRMTDADPGVRFAAAWAVARLTRDPVAASDLWVEVLADEAYRARAAALAARLLPGGAGRRQAEELFRLDGCGRVAVQVAGASGDPAAVPWLLDRMADPAFARLAGEAFALITGADLSRDRLAAAPPPEPDDDEAEDVIPDDPDGGLDWPDGGKVAAWWAANRGRFADGVRHLCGRPVSAGVAREVLRHGYQRQRAAAALELALLEPGTPLFEVRAPGWRQAGG